MWSLARGTHPAATSSTSPLSWRSIHHRISFMPLMSSCHSISSSKDSASRSYASRRVASRTRGDFGAVAEADDSRRSGEPHEHGAVVEPSIVPYPTAVPATTVAAAPKAPSAPNTSRIGHLARPKLTKDVRCPRTTEAKSCLLRDDRYFRLPTFRRRSARDLDGRHDATRDPVDAGQVTGAYRDARDGHARRKQMR